MPPELDGAAGGQETGNAGDTSRDLDAAIAAAFSAGGQDPDGQGNPQDIDDSLTHPDVAKLAGRGPKAGDNRDRDDPDAAPDQQAKTGKEDAVEGTEPDDKALVPPKHWDGADKQTFAKLTREGQEVMLKLSKNLEGGYTRKFQELSDRVKFADAMRGQFTDEDRAQLRQAGVDEVGAVQYLMGLQRMATKEPIKYVHWAMHNLGVTPQDLFPQTRTGTPRQGDPSDQPQSTGDPKLDELLTDPAVKQLRAELEQHKQTIAQIAGKLSERDRAELDYAQRQQYARRQSLLGIVKDFRGALDDNGHQKYPHFDTIYQRMGALMDTDPRLRAMPDGLEKMAKAYDQILRGDPELGESLIEAEVSRRMAAAQKKADAERAKRATRVQPSSGAPVQRSKSASIDDAIAASFAKHGF